MHRMRHLCCRGAPATVRDGAVLRLASAEERYAGGRVLPVAADAVAARRWGRLGWRGRRFLDAHHRVAPDDEEEARTEKKVHPAGAIENERRDCPADEHHDACDQSKIHVECGDPVACAIVVMALQCCCRCGRIVIDLAGSRTYIANTGVAGSIRSRIDSCVGRSGYTACVLWMIAIRSRARDGSGRRGLIFEPISPPSGFDNLCRRQAPVRGRRHVW